RIGGARRPALAGRARARELVEGPAHADDHGAAAARSERAGRAGMADRSGQDRGSKLGVRRGRRGARRGSARAAQNAAAAVVAKGMVLSVQTVGTTPNV